MIELLSDLPKPGLPPGSEVDAWGGSACVLRTGVASHAMAWSGEEGSYVWEPKWKRATQIKHGKTRERGLYRRTFCDSSGQIA